MGETYIGKLTGGMDGFLLELEKVFRAAGIPATALEDTDSVIWSKLIINVAFNALTALTRLKNKDLVARDEGRRLMAMVVEEAVRVAEKKGIALAFEDPLAHCLEIGAGAIGNNTTSMLNDVLHERLAEIDVINGAIVAEGRKLGLPTPANEVVTLLLKTIHNTYGVQIRPDMP